MNLISDIYLVMVGNIITVVKKHWRVISTDYQKRLIWQQKRE